MGVEVGFEAVRFLFFFPFFCFPGDEDLAVVVAFTIGRPPIGQLRGDVGVRDRFAWLPSLGPVPKPAMLRGMAGLIAAYSKLDCASQFARIDSLVDQPAFWRSMRSDLQQG